MPTKLKNLKIKRVALVDEGANPDAHVRFAKSKDAPPDSTDMTADEALSIMDRLVAFVRSPAALLLRRPLTLSPKVR